MEFVQGTSLQQLLKQVRVAPRDAVRLAAGLLSALEYLAEQDIVRLDMKPSSIMITGAGDDEIEAYNAIPTAKKRLVTIGGSTHMTLYSDVSLRSQAARAACDWFVEHFLAAVPVAVA